MQIRELWNTNDTSISIQAVWSASFAGVMMYMWKEIWVIPARSAHDKCLADLTLRSFYVCLFYDALIITINVARRATPRCFHHIQFDARENAHVERDVPTKQRSRDRSSWLSNKQAVGNEERWDGSKTGRTMVLLTFDEEESPIRHYYKRHFINSERVISCQIDPLAFVKMRNYDGSRIYHVKRIAWKFNWGV